MSSGTGMSLASFPRPPSPGHTGQSGPRRLPARGETAEPECPASGLRGLVVATHTCPEDVRLTIDGLAKLSEGRYNKPNAEQESELCKNSWFE
eukprot:6180970-Pleurochrysis_carterae.AAC.3